MNDEVIMIKRNIRTLTTLNYCLLQTIPVIEEVRHNLKHLELRSIDVAIDCCCEMLYDLTRNVDTLSGELADIAYLESKENK